MSITAPITRLKGVGESLAGKLARLGIYRVMDMLLHLPLRYEDRTKITPIGSLQPGDTVVVEGRVQASDVTFGRRRSLLALIEDGTGRLGLRFYHFNKSQQNGIGKAERIRCYGEVRRGATGLEIYHPEYQLDEADDLASSLTPVYPTTEGVTQARLRGLVRQALASVDELEELLPDRQPGIREAVRLLHEPLPADDIHALLDGQHPAQQRLAFEELLAYQLGMAIARREAERLDAPVITATGTLRAELNTTLPFTLTGAQQRVIKEIEADLEKPAPTLRLVQGDVGSGKTVVAAMAAVQTIESGYQVAMMAPTEILAEQHYLNMTAWLEPLGIQIAWLSGKIKGARRTQTLGAMASGDAQLVIGTHALFQRDVSFANLALVIVDEQHRFGVNQRMALRDKGAVGSSLPHQLIMTATPIPRTLTMTLYANMACSIIDELPAGRQPVITTVLANERRPAVIDRVAAACAGGAQAYWVCTLIEESEELSCEAAEETHRMLSDMLPDFKVGLVHGRLRTEDKARVMAAFKAGDIQLLVATTVIEVGVDVPNASLMVIDNAERLGLTQLHQLRGRVGRGDRESHCVLLYQGPLGQVGKARLAVMRESNDGFYIADQDLRIRGPGDVLGARQSGMLQFRIADLGRDAGLLTEVSQLSGNLLKREPERAAALVNRWTGDAGRFTQV